jgi:16S rRNA (cytosine1402-N4)-methyltransferase
MTRAHVPVLAGELIGLLDPAPGEIAVDCTFGDGGHARLVADRIGPSGTLIAIDRDPLAEESFAELAAEVPCATRFIRADFEHGLRLLAEEGVQADLVYLDLGMSSMQVDTLERGFSYAYDAPLDMRMDPDQELTAREVVNTWERRRLARALREYGEERYADRIAGAIVRARPLETTFELVEAIKAAIPAPARFAGGHPAKRTFQGIRIAGEIVRRRGRAELTTTFELNDAITAAIPAPARFAGGHPAKRTFQAIRIAVNGELQQLDDALPLAWQTLKIGGRFAAISFHSLEDRRVKRFLADLARECICPPDLPVCVCGSKPEAELLHRRSIVPTPGEVAANPRSKSARLRAARKLREER